MTTIPVTRVLGEALADGVYDSLASGHFVSPTGLVHYRFYVNRNTGKFTAALGQEDVFPNIHVDQGKVEAIFPARPV